MEKESACAYKTKKKMALALQELMRQHDFEKITVADITDRCDLHRQTFYYHFQDRYQLLDWLLYHELFQPFIEDITIENVYEHFYRLFDTIYADKPFYNTAMQIDMHDLYQQVGITSKKLFALVMEGLSPLKDGMTKKEELLFSEFFGYGISGIVLEWGISGMQASPEEMTEKIKHLADICKKIAGR